MTDDAQEQNQWIGLARRGDPDALGRLLETYRPYLRLLAQRQLGDRIGVRVDASDIVQQTCLEAHRDFQRFLGTGPPELLAWLQRILDHNVAGAIRDHALLQKRAVSREQSLDARRDSHASPADNLPAAHTSPSRRAIRGEAAVRLARALDRLPPDQREAVRLRHLEGCSLAQIAAQLNRTPVAAAGLIKRGLQALRQELREIN